MYCLILMIIGFVCILILENLGSQKQNVQCKLNALITDSIFLVIKGLAMGAANKVPGCLGGVVAFVAGFYEEFIFSLQRINKTAFKLLVNGRFKSFFQYVNGRFLSLLFFGMIVSYFSVSKILDYLIEQL